MLTTLMLLVSTAFAGTNSSEHASLQLGLVYAMPAALTVLSSDQAFVAAETGISTGYGVTTFYGRAGLNFNFDIGANVDIRLQPMGGIRSITSYWISYDESYPTATLATELAAWTSDCCGLVGRVTTGIGFSDYMPVPEWSTTVGVIF